MAAIFPVRLFKAIHSGFNNQLRRHGVTTPGVISMHEAEHGRKDEHAKDDGSAMIMQRDNNECAKVNGHILRLDDGEGPFYDDLTKQQLPTQVMKAPRRKGLDYFEGRDVWKQVSVAEALRISGRSPISVRWVVQFLAVLV